MKKDCLKPTEMDENYLDHLSKLYVQYLLRMQWHTVPKRNLCEKIFFLENSLTSCPHLR